MASISPNPVRGQFTLTHRLPAEFPVAQFTLYNATGGVVWQQEFAKWQPTHTWQMPPGLPAGIYLWQVTYMGQAAATGKLAVE